MAGGEVVTIKEAKTILRSIRRAKHERDGLMRLKQKAFEDAISITAQMDKEPIAGGMPADLFSAYVEYSEALDKSTCRLFSLQLEIMRVVSALPDSRCRELIMEYYIEGMTWEQVAIHMNYSYSQVVEEIHSKALKQFAEKYPIKSDIPSMV